MRMVDPVEASSSCEAVAAESSSFERDTVTWTFAKLAECVLDQLFEQAGERDRYALWLRREAPLLAESASPEQGLLLVDLDLGSDGQLSVMARPCEGEFVLTVQHLRFNVVLASAYAALAPEPEQECVCVAHFDGDAPLAARWASGLRHSLERCPSHPVANGAQSCVRLN